MQCCLNVPKREWRLFGGCFLSGGCVSGCQVFRGSATTATITHCDRYKATNACQRRPSRARKNLNSGVRQEIIGSFEWFNDCRYPVLVFECGWILAPLVGDAWKLLRALPAGSVGWSSVGSSPPSPPQGTGNVQHAHHFSSPSISFTFSPALF